MTSGEALSASARVTLARSESDARRAREILARLTPALSQLTGDVTDAIQGTATGADRVMVECLQQARVDLQRSDEALAVAARLLETLPFPLRY